MGIVQIRSTPHQRWLNCIQTEYFKDCNQNQFYLCHDVRTHRSHAAEVNETEKVCVSENLRLLGKQLKGFIVKL